MALNTAAAVIFISISRAPSVVNTSSASTKPPPSRTRRDRISLSQIDLRIASSHRSTLVPGTNWSARSIARRHVACTRSSATSRALDNTSAYRQRRAREGSSPARTSRRLASLIALLDMIARRAKRAGRIFLLRRAPVGGSVEANNWRAGVFPGLRISNRKDPAMPSFLNPRHEIGASFVSALCCGLIVASLALATPAFAAGGGAGGAAVEAEARAEARAAAQVVEPAAAQA